MKVKVYKNEYGHGRCECPFCGVPQYIRTATKAAPDTLRDLKRHITNQAKNEALQKAIQPDLVVPHLTYFLAHTTPRVIPSVNKRSYDEDLTI